MAFELPPLPFDKNALDPYMSAETLEFHHGKHHASYVAKLNDAIEGTDNADKSLEDIIKGAEINSGLFNNAAQHWNHSFFWNCLSPNGGGEASGEVADLIGSSFGSFAKFSEEFSNAAATQFGSGWAWLVTDGSKLSVEKTANADLPLKHDAKALLTIDVWEHAYYIDYRNARPKFIETVLANLVNWDFVNQTLAG
ncbi:MAG TPA: superoxide dismutase [Acidimicrobiales bacterium]|nr:superoxide dismutase [Acidimicrobiales bacterium]